jgi:hypothetical protein
MDAGLFAFIEHVLKGFSVQLKACGLPLPIGWISTLSAAEVVNIAPYGFLSGLASDSL